MLSSKALRTGNPCPGTMTNSEDTEEMPHYAAFSSGPALFAKTKSIFRERNIILLW